MGFWKVLLSRISGKVPSVNQMESETLSWNERDGILYGKKTNSNGISSIVPIGGGGLQGETHTRAHVVTSAEDHLPVLKEDFNKLLATNQQTGAIELIAKSSLDKYYRHIQTYPSSEWQISHNLQKYPSVTITDTSGSEIEGGVQYIDSDSLLLTFSASFAGFADLN